MKLLLPLLLFSTSACLQDATDTSDASVGTTGHYTLHLAEGTVRLGDEKLETNISQIEPIQIKRKYGGNLSIPAGQDLTHTNTRLEFSNVEFSFTNKVKQYNCKMERVPLVGKIEFDLNSKCPSEDNDTTEAKIDVCLNTLFNKDKTITRNISKEKTLYEKYIYRSNNIVSVYIGSYEKEEREINIKNDFFITAHGDYEGAMTFMREKEIYCEEDNGKLFLVFPLKEERGHKDYQRIELTKATYIGLLEKEVPALGVHFAHEDDSYYHFYDTDTEGIIKTHKHAYPPDEDKSIPYREEIILENYQKQQ